MEKILIIADDSPLADELSLELRNEGLSPEIAPAGSDGKDSLGRHYDVIIIGVSGKGGRRGKIIADLDALCPSTAILLVAPPSDKDAAKLSIHHEVDFWMPQSARKDLLRQSVRLAIAHRKLLLENRELKRQVEIFTKAQEIGNCLELDRLAVLAVTALANEAGVERGLGLFLDEEGFLSVKGLHGLDEAVGRLLGERVMAAYEKRRKKKETVSIVTDLVPEGDSVISGTGIRDGIICGMYAGEELRGIIAVFNDRDQRFQAGQDLADLSFLAEQSSRAIENATRYTTAKNLANIDELTGLFNYRYLETALDREIKRAERYRSSLSVVFLDLDQFKVINDTFGHLVGSKVLKEVGLLIKHLVREVDTVIRYGGDEYTIILVESTNVGAARVAERIRSAVEQFTFLGKEGYSIKLTASLGYACYPDDSKSHTELLDMADRAMYRGKFSGKNVVFHIKQAEDATQGE